MVHRSAAAHGRGAVASLRLSLRNVRQLFNSMDPSPFYERDLDEDAERFLLSSAQEAPPESALKLIVHLDEIPAEGRGETLELLNESIHNHFAERARLAQMEFRRLLREGRTSLGIGLVFLMTCLGAAEIVAATLEGVFPDILRESLMIAGWVAMWRPLEVYLYDWWPVRRQQEVFRRMAHMPIELKIDGAP